MPEALTTETAPEDAVAAATAPDPSQDKPRSLWSDAWRDLRRFSTGGTYLNFLTEEEAGDRLKAAWGQNYDRLQDVKRKWDPTNFFRFNQNIPPSGD